MKLKIGHSRDLSTSKKPTIRYYNWLYKGRILSGYEVQYRMLELTKAFDRVPHMHLCNKLSYYGINDNILKWIKNFLHSRTQQVIVEGHHSSSINVISGVVACHMLSVPPLSNLPRLETPPQPVVRLKWVERAIIALNSCI